MMIFVAVAVIFNKKGQILISKRFAHQHQGNKWEFPGGKLEEGETAQQALQREIAEEIGITIKSCHHLIEIKHRYKNTNQPDSPVCLHVFEVDDWTGEPQGREGQAIRWVEKDALQHYSFPKANNQIIQILCAT